MATVIGSGEAGLADGTYERARFSHPQGLALDGRALLVADTENHALRVVDLDTRQVKTLAGDGRLSYSRTAEAGVIRLNSPWALWREGRVLYIAMAGLHQLWSLDLETGRHRPLRRQRPRGAAGRPPGERRPGTTQRPHQ